MGGSTGSHALKLLYHFIVKQQSREQKAKLIPIIFCILNAFKLIFLPTSLSEFPIPHGWNSAPAATWGDSAHEQRLFCFTAAHGEGAEGAGRERWVSVGPH